MSHDARMIASESMISTWASTGGPEARTIIIYSPLNPHLPECSPS